ncbi:MAG: translocation/assembly module TamB domain-containing protein [Bacteroidota bacterium]
MGSITASLLALLICIILVIRLPSVQSYIVKQALSWFSSKVDTEASIKGIYIDFPVDLVLEGLYVEDQAEDTLVYFDKLSVNTDLWQLSQNKINIEQLSLSDLTANIHTLEGDSVFNFQFMVNAFPTEDPSPKEQKRGKPFEIGLEDLVLKNTSVVFKDGSSGIDLQSSFRELSLSMDEFDLNENVLHIDRLSLQGLRGFVKQLPSGEAVESEGSEAKSDQESTKILDLTAKNLRLGDIDFRYFDPTQIDVLVKIGFLDVYSDSLDIEDHIYVASKLKLEDAEVELELLESDEITSYEGNKEQSSSSEENALIAGAKQADLSNVRFRMIKEGEDSVIGFDPFHMDIRVESLKGDEVRYENEEAWGTIKELSASSGNDFQVHEFSSKVYYGLTRSYAENLKTRIENSFIEGNLKVSYPKITTFADSLELTEYDIDIRSSEVQISDASYFAPLLDSLVAQNPYLGSTMNLQLKGSGKFDSLKVDKLHLSTFDSTVIKTQGRIFGLPEVEQLGLQLQSIDITTTKDDINQFIGDSTGLNWPGTVRINGGIAGNRNKLETKLKIRQSLGLISLNLKAEKLFGDIPKYKGTIEFSDFHLGKLLGNSQLNDISGSLNIDAQGKSAEQLKGSLGLMLDSIDFSGYTYKNLELKSNSSNGVVKADFRSEDPNFNISLNALTDLSDEKPGYQFGLSMNTVDLRQLNYTSEIIKLRVDITGNAMFNSIDDLDVNLDFKALNIRKGEELHNVDDFTLAAISSESQDQISLSSEIIDFQAKGDYSLLELPLALEAHFQNYLKQNADSTIRNIEDQSLSFRLELKDPELLTSIFLPIVSNLKPGIIEGNFNSGSHQLNARAEIYEADIQSIGVDSLSFSINSDKDDLNASLSVANIFYDTLAIRELLFTTQLKDQEIFTKLTIGDQEEQTRYTLGGTFSRPGENYQFSLDPDDFRLNGERWNVKKRNKITFLDDGIWVEALKINKSNQSVQLQSAVSNGDSLLQLDINRFLLSSLGTLSDGTGSLLGGLLNVDLDIFSADILGFDGSIDIENFSFSEDTIGNIRIEGNSEDKVNYSANLEISSDENNITAGLRYSNTENKKINGEIDINQISLGSIEPFLADFASDPMGKIDGGIKITGTLNEPVFNGSIHFNKASLLINQINNGITINDQSFKLNNKSVLFDKFTIEDQKSNKVVLNGDVSTTDYSDVLFNLDITANNFTFINSTSKENDLYYGKLVMNTDASVRGKLARPTVKMNVHVLEASDFTYVIPQSQIEVQNRENVVQFFDQDKLEDSFFDEEDIQLGDTLISDIEGIDLSAKIDTEPGSTFNVIVDSKTGDRLTVKGEANLNLNINPSGDITLNGRYEVNDGEYKLNFYSLAKREFKIQPGSYISWSGDPLEARLAITAIYTVRAFAPNSDENLLYDVFLNINGELAQPEIGFKINANEANNVSGRINGFLSSLENDESELNTQVFYLLVFKSFKSSNSVTGTGGGNAGETAARNSVSQILTSQLNKLTSKVKGVELSLDVDSYQTGADRQGRTQLELGVSKELFNERVVVKVSSNLDLENQSNESQEFSGDVRIEYKLTEDGRYRLVGFRENEFDNFIQGEVTKTGAGIIFVKDFNALKELFESADSPSESGGSND